jgi:hypothetical protein
MQPVSDGSAVPADLVRERAVDLGPARANPVGLDVLLARHRGDRVRQPRALVGGAVDLDALTLLFDVRHRAESRRERAANVAQEREGRVERRVELDRPEVEQAISGTARECGGDAGARRGSQAVAGLVGLGVGWRRVDEERAGGKDCHAEHRIFDALTGRQSLSHNRAALYNAIVRYGKDDLRVRLPSTENARVDFGRVLQTIAEFFDLTRFPYAVIGAFGLHAYGLSRGTFAMDFVTQTEGQAQLVGFLESLGYETLHVSTGYSSHLHALAALGRIDIVYVGGETSERLFRDVRMMPGPTGQRTWLRFRERPAWPDGLLALVHARSRLGGAAENGLYVAQPLCRRSASTDFGLMIVTGSPATRS